MSENLSTSVQFLKSVGPKRADSFAQIGIRTIRDLLFYFPTRYLDRTTILNTVRVVQYITNGYEGEVTVIGKVMDSELIRYEKKQIFKVIMKDNSGTFDCVWFQGVKYFKDRFKPGEYFAVSAKPTLTRYGNLQFTHPDFDKLADIESEEFLHTGKIIPFYRLPKELKSSNLGDLSLRRIIHSAVETYVNQLEESLPRKIIDEQQLFPLKDSVKNLHFPESHDLLVKAQRRFKFEELFYLECLVALRKVGIKEVIPGYKFKMHPEPIKRFIESLPFKLTDSQLRVLGDIRKDMETEKPMNRLLQGDVGSGKTIVSLIAMLIAIENGFQTALMVPTEILADQHYKKISNLLAEFNINVQLLIGGQKKSEREKILEMIEEGRAQIVIGTHALIESKINFKQLGLIVIDEQHRFGVVQRSSLIEKGRNPDTLVMTATPIPRTLSMTVYGDLDVSIITEMPKDRKPIKTLVRGEEKLPDIYKFIIDKAKEGVQTYLVYPLVEESEKLELKAAQSYYEDLSTTFLKDVRVCLIHGKMNWKDKEEIMYRFANKEYDVLVSTTVIEVGIDIPDANIMVINDAFRFGLSQLHQLRGRVGRSDKQAYCVLITKKEFASRSNKFNFDFEYMSAAEIERYKSIIRLNAMIKHPSGFELSEIDLKLRGPGDIYGIKQSGLPLLKFADITTDGEIITAAKLSAFNVIENDIRLTKKENALIRQTLLSSYSDNLKYSHIA